MVVQYKEIDDIIDEKYTDEVVFKYIQELILATEKAKKALGDDGEAFNVERKTCYASRNRCGGRLKAHT